MYTHKGFLLRYFALTLVAALPLAASYVFLVRAGEHTAFHEIARWQRESGAIYGGALNQNNYLYKLELAALAKPAVIALGSSRALQFREEFFSVPFVNCGGAMNSPAEGAEFLQELLSRHKPELAIITVDFWWLAQTVERGTGWKYHENTGDILTAKKLYAPLAYLATGKIPPDVFLGVVAGKARVTPIGGNAAIGVQAIVSSWGFRRDGSLFYSQVYDMNFPDHEIGLANTIAQAKEGVGKFIPFENPAAGPLADMVEIADMLRSNRVKAVFILPPIAPSAWDAVKAGQLAGASAIVGHLRSLGHEAYDLHDARAFGSSDCEFLDGLHGGDVAYQRLLVRLAEDNPGSTISSFLKVDAMKSQIEAFAGDVMSTQPGERPGVDEVDFLRLGCVKKKWRQ